MQQQKSLFGTDGIRRTFGNEPLTSSGLVNLTNAIARWLILQYSNNIIIEIAIGCDTRNSCPQIYNALINGLNQYNIKSIFFGVIPTPAIARFVHAEEKFKAGFMITASHNLYQDNGIKIFNSQGNKISDVDESIINNFYYDETEKNLASTNTNEDSKEIGTNLSIKYTQSEDIYYNILTQITKLNSSSFLGIKIVLDLANGALFSIAPNIFRKYGAHVIEINNSPNGININKNCGAVNPKRLQDAVIHHNATLGFAFDGDGDRVIAVNHFGELKNGDDILAIISSNPYFETCKTLVGTIMTNLGLEKHLINQGKQLERTNVGDKNIANFINANYTTQSFGGEPSGHILLPNQPITSDALLAALICLKSALLTNNINLSSYISYPQINITIPITKQIKLESKPIVDLINNSQALLPKGRLLLRYSGTEPCLRIMGEDKDANLVKTVVTKLATSIQHLF